MSCSWAPDHGKMRVLRLADRQGGIRLNLVFRFWVGLTESGKISRIDMKSYLIAKVILLLSTSTMERKNHAENRTK